LAIISLSAAVFIVLAYLVGGNALVMEGFSVSLQTATGSVLMLVASFLVIGQIQVLLTQEMLANWLQKYSGSKKIIVAALAGGLFPGGPYVYYPFAVSFTGKGLPFYILIAFLFGKKVYDFSRIPMETSLIDARIALIRNLITFPIPIMAGLLTQRFFGNRTVESIFGLGGDEDGSNHRNP
jgi:uncharacterized membrane protein YraQ (UPF0718 family)